jgi:sugar phosphate permease
MSLGSSLRSLEQGVLNPVWGPIVDRYSAKWLMRVGVITSALGMFCLSQTRGLGMYYTGFLIVGLGSSLVTSILPQTVIARWFRKDLGKASGVFYMGAGLGGVLVPVVAAVIDKLSWQITLLYGAVGFLVLGIPLSFVMRGHPADYGLLPDGRVADPASALATKSKYDFAVPVRKALKMRAFWHIGIATLFQTAAVSAIMLHAMPYLTGLGKDRIAAGMVISLYTLISLFGRAPFGALSDVSKKNYAIALSVGLMGLGFLLFWLIDSTTPFWLIVLFAIAYGLGVSGAQVLKPPILVEYFGTKNFGAIFGVSSIFGSVGMVAGAPMAGLVFDTYHDYKICWLAMAGLLALGVILMLTIPRAQTKAD